MSEETARPLGLACTEELGLDPTRIAWAICVEVARGRMHGGWVPVDAKLLLEQDAEIERLRALRAATAEGRTYTQADLIEAVKTERHACSIAVWMALQDALAPDADDKGLDGWMREAEARVKGRIEGVDPELAHLRADLDDYLRHVIDVAKGEHYLDVVRLNAEALLKRITSVLGPNV